MGLWVAYLLLGVLAGLMLAYPLLRRKGAAQAAPQQPTAEEARAAPRSGLPNWLLPAAGVAAVLAAAVGLYVLTGEDQPAPVAAGPLGTTQAGTDAMLPDVDTMIDRLAKRLEASPNDPEGWRMLGWSYFATGRHPEAVKAYAKAVGLKPGDAAIQAAYGEAQVKASGDLVTPQAEKAFRAALAADPDETRAQVYLARLRHQQGASAAALETLFAILGRTPADSPLQPTIRDAIRNVAADSGVDVANRLPPEPAGPTAQDVQAAQQMSPSDQQAMIDGMVARLETRLAASPRDADGWIMLMRSRKRMGQDGLAKSAFEKALGVFRDDPAATARLRAAAEDLGVG